MQLKSRCATRWILLFLHNHHAFHGRVDGAEIVIDPRFFEDMAETGLRTEGTRTKGEILGRDRVHDHIVAGPGDGRADGDGQLAPLLRRRYGFKR